jgi:hypothetical protein
MGVEIFAYNGKERKGREPFISAARWKCQPNHAKQPSGTVPPENRGTRSVAGERRKSAVVQKNHGRMKAGAPRMARACFVQSFWVRLKPHARGRNCQLSVMVGIPQNRDL